MTDVPEGTIVRVITRLDETCREVRDAARVIGDADLFTKMEEAQALIKRDSESSASYDINHYTADLFSRFRSQLGMFSTSALPDLVDGRAADEFSIYSIYHI